MAIVFSKPGFFFTETTISSHDLEKIQAARSLDEVGTFWDKISDFFFGTERVKAKRLFFGLDRAIKTGGSDAEKKSYFFALEKLAGAEYKRNFGVDSLPMQTHYRIMYSDGRSFKAALSFIVEQLQDERRAARPTMHANPAPPKTRPRPWPSPSVTFTLTYMRPVHNRISLREHARLQDQAEQQREAVFSILAQSLVDEAERVAKP